MWSRATRLEWKLAAQARDCADSPLFARQACTRPSRRMLLQQTAAGFGWLAFSALHAQWSRHAEPKPYKSPLAPKQPHFAAKAKRVIFLFMAGGPSHIDTFDWKPTMVGMTGGRSKHLGPVFPFRPAGKSGVM